MEIDHILPKPVGERMRWRTSNSFISTATSEKQQRDSRCPGPYDKRHVVEEPDEAKASRPVL